MGSAVHELMHALGWYHTQSRSDRDSYVDIHFENMDEEWQYQFKVKNSNVYEQVQKCRPYNYGSIMHYDDKAGSNNGKNTITTWDSRKQGVIGQDGGLNPQDIEEIDRYYFGSKKCTVSKSPVTSDTTEVLVGKSIAIKTIHNTYLRAEPGRHAKVDTQRFVGDWERFSIEQVSGQNGVFAIKTIHNTYLRAEPGVGAKVDTQKYIGDWEKFTIEEITGQNGVFAIQTAHSTYLRAEPGHHAKVDTQTYIGDWEKFRFQRI